MSEQQQNPDDPKDTFTVVRNEELRWPPATIEEAMERLAAAGVEVRPERIVCFMAFRDGKPAGCGIGKDDLAALQHAVHVVELTHRHEAYMEELAAKKRPKPRRKKLKVAGRRR